MGGVLVCNDLPARPDCAVPYAAPMQLSTRRAAGPAHTQQARVSQGEYG